MRSGFLSVLIAAVLTVWMLAGAGAYLLNKILNNDERDEPEVLAISEEIEIDSKDEDLGNLSEDLGNLSEDLDLDLDLKLESGKSENKIKNIEKPAAPAVNKEPVKNKLNKKARVRNKGVKKANKRNLDGFKVKAIKADEDDMLPKDKSKSLNDLKLELNKKRESKNFDGGKGLIGDIYRGAKKIVDGADKAALDASRKVGSAVDVDVDKARLRPGGGGVKLHLDIAPKGKN